jgi:septum formation protein
MHHPPAQALPHWLRPPAVTMVIHMSILTLASSSVIRATLLRNAGLEFTVEPARIDEGALIDSLVAEGATPRDIADALTEAKAMRRARPEREDLILGCDQVLDMDGKIFTKPESPEMARAQLMELRGRAHKLHSAAVIYHRGQPIWRHVDSARLTMRPFSDAFLDSYIAQNWEEIRHTVGCYQIEGPGIRLFERVEGSHFTILGLPLLPLLSFLTLRKDILA